MRPHLERSQEEGEEPDFGTFLKLLRTNKRIRQGTIAALLADKGWTPTTYTRLENGDIAPRFADLVPLYRAFLLADVSFSLTDRQQYVQRARSKIERKKTHREQHSDAEWAQLRYELARLDGLPDATDSLATTDRVSQKPLLTDTEHLLGREQWREHLLACVDGTIHKKLIVLHGPAGIGKSSELHWLATTFLRHSPKTHLIILCDLRSLSYASRPEDAFHVFASTVLVELGCTLAPTGMPSLDELTQQVLQHLEKARMPLLVLLDHAECLLQEDGSLAPCWERWFTALLRVQHRSTLVLASQQWPGWYQGERQFLAECSLPPLSRETSLLVLQQHGLDSVPVALLEQIHDRVGGIPLALEWVAAMVKQPLEMEDWEEFGEQRSHGSTEGEGMTGAIERLLAEPHIFGGTLADDIAPLLQRIITTQHLSLEARTLLEVLAVARIPLAKPALQHLCPRGPRPIKELRRASVLVSYPERIQLLPILAAAMYRELNAEQRKEREATLIEACRMWRQAGIPDNRERGIVVTELAILLLKHHSLVEAAILLMRDGWLSFNLGNGPRLAEYAFKMLQQFDWQATGENRCGGLLLRHMLGTFLGQPIDEEQRARDYQMGYDSILAGKGMLPPNIELHVTHRLMFQAIQALYFEEAHALLEVRCERLAETFPLTLIEERASLYGEWSDYADEKGDHRRARELREQAILLYRECSQKIAARIAEDPYNNTLRKRGLGRCLNDLSYNLNRTGRYEEALQAIEKSLSWREQGYVEFGGLALSYGEKSQILMELGRLQEAILFDKKAIAEIEQCARTGHTYFQEEVWIYYVNRARLYLRLGRVDEAEQLLRVALPCYIPGRRRNYHMFAEDALEEIEQWRQKTTASHYRLDWRWVERYRTLASFDSYWWLAAAGPLTDEEQREWERLPTRHLDEATKGRLSTLMARSTRREVNIAMDEQREPLLHYPAMDIQEVQTRIAGLLQLDAEIVRDEPNALVRRLYHETIEEELHFLYLIQATCEGSNESFWKHNLALNPLPTQAEMHYVISRVKHYVLQGFLSERAKEASERFLKVCEHYHLSFDLSFTKEEEQILRQVVSFAPSQQQARTISAQAARRFFEAVFQKADFTDWQVAIDPNADSARIEQGLRRLFLASRSYSLKEIRHMLSHELAGHVARCMAGERSLLGLLGIHSKNSLETEEGLGLYYERLDVEREGGTFDETGLWLGTLATGLASGVLIPPQTFSSLYTFFVSFFAMYRLLVRPDQDAEAAQNHARRLARERCLRTFRGVPQLTQAGICYTKDAHYLRGLRKIEKALQEDERVLDRLAVGVVALDRLPDLQELGIMSAPRPLRTLAEDSHLDEYITTFE